MEWDIEIDAVGLLCPLPVLRLRKRLQGLQAGQIVRIIATDQMAQIDIPHFCQDEGHEVLKMETLREGTAFLVRKGSCDQ